MENDEQPTCRLSFVISTTPRVRLPLLQSVSLGDEAPIPNFELPNPLPALSLPTFLISPAFLPSRQQWKPPLPALALVLGTFHLQTAVPVQRSFTVSATALLETMERVVGRNTVQARMVPAQQAEGGGSRVEIPMILPISAEMGKQLASWALQLHFKIEIKSDFGEPVISRKLESKQMAVFNVIGTADDL